MHWVLKILEIDIILNWSKIGIEYSKNPGLVKQLLLTILLLLLSKKSSRCPKLDV